MTASSQVNTLSPILHIQGNDTLRCWEFIRAADIAKRIAYGESCIEEVKQYDHLVKVLDSLILVKDRQIVLMKQEARNTLEAHGIQKDMISGYKADSEVCNKKLKRNKLITRLSIGGMILFGAIAIIK